MKKVIYTLLLLFAFIATKAQDLDSLTLKKTENSGGAGRFWKNIKIRQGFETEEEKGEPAITSITFPKDGANSFLFNGGISYSASLQKAGESKKFKYIFAPIITWNRNNQIDKEQRNFKTGILNQFSWGKHDPAKGLDYLILNNSVQYQHDKIEASHSIIATAYLSQVRSKRDGRLYLNTYKYLGSGFQYLISYNLGGELQNKYEASDANQKGAIVRGFYSFEGRLALKVDRDGGDASLGTKFLELSATQTGRYAFINTTGNREGHLPLSNVELNFYPTASDMFSIGLSYTSGSDPIDGLLDQDFYLLAAKFKL